jgi:hypothetical protein
MENVKTSQRIILLHICETFKFDIYDTVELKKDKLSVTDGKG